MNSMPRKPNFLGEYFAARFQDHPALRDGPIYLDYNATTPVDPAVVEAMLPYLASHFGNPSSSHRYGQIAHEAVATARVRVAGLLGCSPAEIAFTAGGSELSPVLMAMGCTREQALRALRLTLGRWSTEHDVDRAAGFLAKSVDSLSQKRYNRE